VQKAPKINWLW